ncbi:glycine oxidase ThiO [Paenibacillus sp. sptzw28]|uniref:glycine oxidase ThiO n=1 Tax=Paenibacillus sp. sptzw28 TaxID=715179 RepID=UPI001C6F2ABC|nr:glycine oxidase ThiO [Paenibacillus sp. sptzw28]QYR23002.1 glycine oxidase ThiO [Paenibacillus sp. sptzw28]
MPERVIVLGGGIIGLACAFEAASGGALVSVIEPGAFGGQASGAAAGMLAPYTENPEQPDPFFHLCQDSLRRYPAWVKRVESISGMDAELLHTGSLTVAMHEADVLPLQTRIAWQRAQGAEAELVGPEMLSRLEPELSAQAVAALYCPGESHINAPKLVAALEAACRKLGVALLAHAGEIDAPRIGGASGSGISVSTSGHGIVKGDTLIVCTGAWACYYAETFGFPIPIHPIRGQICSFNAPPPARVNHMVFSSQAYWVGKQNGSLVCGASEDVAGYDSSVTGRGIDRLVRWGPRLFPFLQGLEPASKWAGLRPATRDGLPLIGPVPGRPDIILAAGHYRNGILLSPVTASIVADLLNGRTPGTPIARFAPERFAPATSRSAR